MTDQSLVNCVWYWEPWLPEKPLVETEKHMFINYMTIRNKMFFISLFDFLSSLQCRRYFGSGLSIDQVFDVAILDCNWLPNPLTGRGLRQRAKGGEGWGLRQLFPSFPIPPPHHPSLQPSTVTKSKMAAQCENAHAFGSTLDFCHVRNIPFSLQIFYIFSIIVLRNIFFFSL